MNSRKAITLLVLATIVMALVPLVPVQAINIDTIIIYKGGTAVDVRKGHKLEIEGYGVTAGATLNVYWDDAFKDTFTEGSGKLNSTKAKKDGTFLVWIKVPEALNGLHYIWIKDTSSGDTDYDSVNVIAYLSNSPDSGLKGDTVTVTGSGYGEEVDITDIVFRNDYGTPITISPTPGTPETSVLGSFSFTFKVPTSVTDYGIYWVYAEDKDGLNAEDRFDVGASITLNVEAGPVGKIVQISGRGFSDAADIEQGDVMIDGHECYVMNEPVAVKTDGTFKASVVIPQVDKADDYSITVTETGGNGYYASADFEVTGLAEIEVNPAYGPQGSQVTVEGWNFTQISNTNVIVTLDDVGSKTFKTDSKGYFKGTYTVPAVSSGVHLLVAEQADYEILADASFRAGLMIVILSPNKGPTGTLVTITGTGFTLGSAMWNATFGDVLWVDESDLSGLGTLSTEVYVPTVAPGVYTVTVIDIDPHPNIDVTTSFTVTRTTIVTADPMVAPNGYDVEFTGSFFAADHNEADTVDIEMVIWNSTDSWDMSPLWNDTDLTIRIPSFVDDDGNFTAIWTVEDSDTLGIGSYWINITDSEDLFYQMQFDIVEETVEIVPRKATFKIGETVAFNVETSFPVKNSYIKIWDPSGTLYWNTDEFVEGNWISVGTLKVYPFYEQTAGGNPMVLLEDAPLGTYTWKWYNEDDEVVSSGTLMVAAAATDVLGQQIEDLNNAVTDLTSDISTVSTEVAAVRTQITNAINAANAAVQAANAATQAVNAVAQTANAASTAATNAANAATEAKNAANGLTTLVYGAIGASLVAALAAIVSLMQISRRIAG